MFKIGKAWAIGCLAFATTSLAADDKGGPCGSFASANDVLRCAVQRDKSLKVMEADIGIAAAGVEVGRQRLNPELEVESIKRERGFSHAITLTQSLELGGKRDARERVALAEREAAMRALRKTKENVIVATVANLNRLRQINREVEILQEGISTFNQVSRQFQRAGALSPEQRISISIFKMALEDHRIREAALLSEKQALVSEISLAIGQAFDPNPRYLPRINGSWPKLKSASLDSAGVALAKAETAAARAGYELQKSEAWPDLKLGPKVEVDQNNKAWVGVALAVPLPIYHQNQGGRSQALAKVGRGEILEEKAQDEAQSMYAYLMKSYEEISTSLESTAKNGGVEAKHKDLHALLNRGVVAAPLIIELHRQREEYYLRLHEQELKAIDALWRIYALEGRADKESI